MRHLKSALCALGLVFGFGCSESGEVGETAGGNRDGLAELGAVLKSMAEQKRKPPAKQAEFVRIEPELPVAGPLIQQGEIVYLWGAAYAEGSKKVAAHEKKVPAEGGLVLLQDGTVTEMTAAEFQSAPKAK